MEAELEKAASGLTPDATAIVIKQESIMTNPAQSRKKFNPYNPYIRQPLTPDEIAVLELLLERWPDIFDLAECVPLAVGIDQQIIAAEPALAGPELQAALRWYTSRGRYVEAIAYGGRRADLSGKAAGEVDGVAQARAQTAVTRYNLRGRWTSADWPDTAVAKGVRDE